MPGDLDAARPLVAGPSGREEHRRRARRLLFAYATLALGGVYSVGSVLGGTLFLSRLPARAIPLLFLLPALGILIAFTLYDRLSRRVEVHRLAVATLWTLVGATVLLRLAIAQTDGGSAAVLGLLFLLVFVAGRLAMTQFWTFAGLHLDAREERRHVGRIAVGGMAATAVAGVVVELLVRWIPPADVLWLFVAALLGCSAVARGLRDLHVRAERRRGSRRGRRRPVHADRDARRPARLSRDQRRVAMHLLAFAVLVSLLVNVAAVRYYTVIQDAFGTDAVAMAIFYGRYTVVAGLLAVAAQLATPWALRRLGLGSTLLVFPLGTLVATGASVLAGGSAAASAALVGADRVLRRTSTDAGLSLLFKPLPASVLGSVRARFEWTFALAMGAVGGVLALGGDRLPSSWWIWTLCGAAIAYLVLTATAQKSYLAALGAGTMDRTDAGVPVLGGAARLERGLIARFREMLSDADPLRAAHALSILRTVPFDRWSGDLERALRHPDPSIRRSALDIAVAERARDVTGEILRLASDDDPTVRAAALDAIGRIAPDEAVAVLRPRLDDPDLRVRQAAAAGLLGRGDLDDLLAVAPHAQALLTSDAAAERADGVALLGRAGMRTAHRSFVRGLEDDAPRVRRAALEAVAALGLAEASAATIALLADVDLRAQALEALEAIGASAVPALEAALRDATTPHAVRRIVPYALARAAGSAAASPLERRFDDEDDAVRGAALRAFESLGVEATLERTILDGRVAVEADLAEAALLDHRSAVGSGAGPLLVEALERRAQAAVARLARVLALRDPRIELRHATSGRVWTPAAIERDELAPLAPGRVEMFDVALEGRERSRLLPLLEGDERRVAERVGTASRDATSLASVLHGALRSNDPWLRACALHEVGERRDLAFEPAVRANMASPSALVRQAAVRACARTLRTSDWRPLLREQAARDRDPGVRRYAQALLDAGRGAGGAP